MLFFLWNQRHVTRFDLITFGAHPAFSHASQKVKDMRVRVLMPRKLTVWFHPAQSEIDFPVKALVAKSLTNTPSRDTSKFPPSNVI